MAVKKQKKKRVDKPVKPVVEIKTLPFGMTEWCCAKLAGKSKRSAMVLLAPMVQVKPLC